jgi:hypothetical protein
VSPAGTQWVIVKVRIRKTPNLEEIDGVRLDDMKAGTIREVSPSIGSWLIAERFAEPEMRHDIRAHQDDFLVQHDTADDRVNRSPRRRRHDR